MGRLGVSRLSAVVAAALMVAGGVVAGGSVALGGGPTEVLVLYPGSPTVVVNDTVRLRAYFCPFGSTGSLFGDDGEPQTADDRCEPARATWTIRGRQGRISPKRGRATTFTALRVGSAEVEAKAKPSPNQTFISRITVRVIAEAEPPPPVALPTEALVVYPFEVSPSAGDSVVFTAWVCPVDAQGRPELGVDGWPGNAGEDLATDDGCVLVDAEWTVEGDAAAIVGSTGRRALAGIGNVGSLFPPTGPGVGLVALQQGTGGLSARFRGLSGGTTFQVGAGQRPGSFICVFPQGSRLINGGGAIVTAGHCRLDDPIVPDPGADGIPFTTDDSWNQPDVTQYRRIGRGVSLDQGGSVTGSQIGFGSIIATAPDGSEGVTNFQVIPPGGQDDPLGDFFTSNGIPPSTVPDEQAGLIRRYIADSDLGGRIFVLGSDQLGDATDCATGNATQIGPGVDIDHAFEIQQGSTIQSAVFMSRSPLQTATGFSFALRRTWYPMTGGAPRWWLFQVHDQQTTVGELDAQGQVIPGTEGSASVTDEAVVFEHGIGTEPPGVVLYQAYNMPVDGDPKACDEFVAVPHPSNLPLAGQQGGCVSNGVTLCLNNNRFRAGLDWKSSDGTTGSGSTSPLLDQTSGLFFFSPTNTEVMVRVLDACSINDRYWVFAAASTNVEYTITVTDTQGGETKQYFNPLGNPSPPIQDTSAFATCP